jgi:diguanylate cyclase
MPYDVEAVRAGLEQGHLRLFYQPLIAAHSRNVRGMEALIRWQHPEDGLLGPDAFLPVIERSELMADVTDWVVRTAAHDVAGWYGSGLTVPVSVNLSATLLADPQLAERVLAILAAEGLPPSLLTLEVTETALNADPAAARRVFTTLRGRDVRISIDDFGTGYTSLTALRDHNFDELKIDRSFVSRIRESPADLAVVRAIADLSHRLGLEVVGEGVEDETTARMLEQIGCDVLQGYCFARPQPREQTADWIRTNGGAAGTLSTPRGGRPGHAATGPLPGAGPAGVPDAEDERLAAVDALELTDSAREQALDDLVAVAAEICGAPMAMLTVVGADRQWVMASTTAGGLRDVPREIAFCAHTIRQPGEILEVPDTQEDSRFADNPFVTGAPRVRFYAGAPLVTDEGHPVGSLCVLDSVSRTLSDDQRDALERLSRLAMRHLQTTRSERALRRLCDVMSSLSRMHALGDIPTAGSLITDALQSLMRADGVALSLVPAPGSVIFDSVSVTVADERQRAPADGVVLDSRTEPATAEVLRTRQPLYVADAPGSPHLDQRLVKTFDVASLLYVPVIADDAPFGVIAAWWRAPQPVLPATSRGAATLLADELATTLARLHAQAALRDAADTDPLTGLLNRRTFKNALRRLPAGSAVAVLDLDHFKDLNEAEGHSPGDDVLRSFAAHLRAATRTHDLVARLGGDAFAIATPDLGIAGAEVMLRRLRRSWARTPTFSTGYTATTHAETAMTALERARSALHDAKSAGRDTDRRPE